MFMENINWARCYVFSAVYVLVSLSLKFNKGLRNVSVDVLVEKKEKKGK